MELRSLPILMTAMLVTACGGLPRQAAIVDADNPALAGCYNLYSIVDRAVTDARVMDAEGKKLPGFPYLRSNRLLASLADYSDNREFNRAWLDRLIALDQQGRRIELDNLPQSSKQTLLQTPGVNLDGNTALMTRLGECASAFRDHDLASPKRLELIKSLSRVRDEYSLLLRILGLYPLTRYPVYRGFQLWKEQNLGTFTTPNQQKQWSGKAVIYTPKTGPVETLSPESIAGLIDRTRDPQLGIPDLARDELQQLAQQFAPVFLIDEAGDADRFGQPGWTDNGRLAVETSRPTLFVRPAYTWFEDTILLQLVYTLWFPERPETSGWDILSGKLDGVIWRITIDRDGTPLIADSIHPCGCYHLFFPARDLEKINTTGNELQEDIVTPQRLPLIPAGKHFVLRIASTSHYVESIAPESTLSSSWPEISYRLSVDHLVPDSDLRSMPLPGQGSRSLYQEDGMIAGTERRERWILWPMGIKSPGAMRQWGKHATAFVGRRHFDDPYLITNGFTRSRDD